MINLGGQSRPLDLRDIKLGAVQPPVEIPTSYATDISWLEAIWQDGTPSCGAHAWAHLKAILDHFDTGKQKYSPRWSWLKIKEIDGHPLEVGTDMRSIFRTGSERGACDYNLLPNVFPTTTEAYSDPSVASEEMRKNAHPRIIKAYGFGTPARIKEHIYQNKAVLVLLDVGNTWWGQKLIWPFTRRDSGHFVVAYGYDEDWIYIIDSADKNIPLKKLSPDYPVREVGTAIDIPDEEVKKLIAEKATLQKWVAALQALLKLAQKFNLKIDFSKVAQMLKK